MKKNIMLTIFTLCVILTLVGCKNGNKSIENISSGEYADASQNEEIYFRSCNQRELV